MIRITHTPTGLTVARDDLPEAVQIDRAAVRQALPGVLAAMPSARWRSRSGGTSWPRRGPSSCSLSWKRWCSRRRWRREPNRPEPTFY
jgi:hypothetical protein